MKKASLESLQVITGNSFLMRSFNEKAFSAPYHFHPELELTLILKGEGKRYVGSNMSSYTAGDLVLLGSNLPHCWKSENVKKGQINASSLVVQFKDDFLGQEFLSKVEMNNIKQLFERSRYGLQFLNKSALEARALIEAMNAESNSFQKLILFLQLLHYLASSKQYLLLDKQKHSATYTSSEHKRINEVLAYIVDNFRGTIVLEKAASIAGMTPTAFCKYFKRATRKTFIETVMSYRLNYAAQQLVHTDKAISDVAFESGFGDVSHFYKSFKKAKGFSPLSYRKSFAKEIGE